jgi:hypothetical protein
MLLPTKLALEAMQEAEVNPSDLLKRHVNGDYGDICDEDDGLNDTAIKEGTRGEVTGTEHIQYDRNQ